MEAFVNVLVFVLLVLPIPIIVGLIRPGWLRQATRGQVLGKGLGLWVLLFILLALVVPKPEPTSEAETPAEPQAAAVVEPAPDEPVAQAQSPVKTETAPKQVFDVRSAKQMLSRSVDQGGLKKQGISPGQPTKRDLNVKQIEQWLDQATKRLKMPQRVVREQIVATPKVSVSGYTRFMLNENELDVDTALRKNALFSDMPAPSDLEQAREQWAELCHGVVGVAIEPNAADANRLAAAIEDALASPGTKFRVKSMGPGKWWTVAVKDWKGHKLTCHLY